ncbi:endonuclease/exonuclease/phosphatase family protein [Rubritalea sp.]|uniref:endonuclease/exonuclease/phosphatase family protein n=1 Tax=Rubritalea sp. TaxID=2109375 RepID=UPI003242F2CC
MLRGFFSCLVIGILSYCDSKQETPDWPEIELKSEPSSNALQLPLATARPLADEGDDTCFMAYNLRNYLSMPRGGNRDHIRPKPTVEIQDLVQNIKKVAPDILGVCEIGTQADLDDLTSQLESEGLLYPHNHLHGGADSYRRLAILSKFPIEPNKPNELSYILDGKRHMMLRGILDVTIKLHSGPTRFIGVHLKSKRPSKYWNQAQIRRREAALLRKHVDEVLASGDSHLVVYGDFNDTKMSPTIRAVAGNQHQDNFLRSLNLEDSNGSKWTHYWSYEDVYSRFDYIFVSPKMRAHIETKKSYILDIPVSNTASDHRPLVLNIR